MSSCVWWSRVVGARVGHVIEHVCAAEAVTFSHGQQPLRTEGALGVHVETLALAAAHVHGKLTGDGQGVAQLCLTCRGGGGGVR